MKTTLLLFVLFGLNSIASEILLRNVNIVYVGSETVIPGDVLLNNGRIAEIRKAGLINCEETCKFFDLKGKYLIPGLSDMHTHAFGNSSANGNQDLFMAEKASQKMLAVGVTSFLDLFYPEDEIFAVREKYRKDEFTGAEVFAAGALFTAPGGHGTEYGVPCHVVNSPEEAKKEIGEIAKNSPDAIKIVYDHAEYGHRKMPTLDYKTFGALIEAAKSHNLKSVVHIGTWDDVKDAMKLGADAVTHTPAAPVPTEMFELFHKYGTYWIPTLVVHTGMTNIMRDKTFFNDLMFRSLVSSETIAGYMDYEKYLPGVKLWTAFQQKNEKQYLENFRKLQAAQINILTGTDIGNVGTFVGYSVHTELKLMVENGMNPFQALAASTVTAGKFLNRNQSLREGAIANLVVLDKSPIENIENTKTIHAVISRGQYLPCHDGSGCFFGARQP